MPEQTTESFQRFQKELGEKLQAAHDMGMSDEHIDQATKRIADWLMKEVTPHTPEQALLKEMWHSANDPERHAMSSVLHKIVQKHIKH